MSKTGYNIFQKEALDMYFQNHSNNEIAKQVKKNRHTIENWIKKFGWEEQRNEFRKETAKKANESAEEKRGRITKFLRNIQTKAHKQMLDGDTKVTLGDAIRAAESEARLEGLDVIKIEGKIETQLTAMDMVEVAKEAKEMREKLKNEKNGKK